MLLGNFESFGMLRFPIRRVDAFIVREFVTIIISESWDILLERISNGSTTRTFDIIFTILVNNISYKFVAVPKWK